MKIARSRYQAIAASLAITEHSPRNRRLCSAAAGIHGLFRTEDFQERVLALRENRRPVYRGR
jgi:hypothetical protein